MKLKVKIIASLLLVSLVVSAGTFAYWASNVLGTETTSTGTVTVGSGDSVSTTFDLTNAQDSSGLLVPAGQLANSTAGAVGAIDLSWDVQWLEDEVTSQLAGTSSVADITVTSDVVITLGETVLDSTTYANIYALINVTPDAGNATQLTLDAAAETFAFQITMDEPADQAEYDLISTASVAITFTYTIDSADIVTTDVN
ncbi:hypothetical protein [Candidatus Xianfuyuplasma coldseepsis]|uniref:Uncharacterized protein n=1 Tax=Candidatus Xianfuyuplasma coldseepsis TaxID=2782163 RepID=A0A7L7KSX8_9MOLU|nr:hypothetical protein [Xianfuyuplasma coldseepsis]QMS85336.1 hypothetical protein G4Z02_06070 [Xianfuyuplasma coldseepsis]